MIKKVFIISSILLFLTLVFFGVYNFVFRDIDQIKSIRALGQKESAKEIKNRNDEDKKIISVSNEPVISPTLDKDGEKIRFYNKENGNVKEVSFDGTINNLIFENNLGNLIDVKWSSNKNFVISSFGSSDNARYYLYSYITRKSEELKKGIDNVIWDNQGEKIIYKYFNSETGERSLNIADPDGENWENLISLDDKFKKFSFSHIPQTLFVSFWNYPDAYQETFLNKVEIVGEHESQEVLRNFFGADYLWSPNGKYFLMSSVDEKGGSNMNLSLGDIEKGAYKDLNLPTLVNKCTWTEDSKYIYCALPSNLADNVVMPNDYQDKKFFTQDTFWKVDIENGKKERVVELEDLKEKYDAINLFLSPKEDMLFFVDREDDKLYGIVL